MKDFLNKIRTCEKNNFKKIYYLIFLLFGIVLGILSKWLDNKSIDFLDLNNFFSNMSIWLFIALSISIYSKTPKRASINVLLFFLGMTISYHLYSIIFSGFNPLNYMIGWYILTIISPLLAYICWYAKSNSYYSIIINSLILFVMISSCFSIGMWYISFRGILYTITFLATLIILYKDIKIESISLLIGLLLSFIIRLPLIGG